MYFDVFDVFKHEIQVIRQNVGSYVDGLWVEGGVQAMNIKANVQPTDAEVLETLPEGYRTKENYTLYTHEQLFTSEKAQNPDVVIIDDEKYQVVKVMKYRWNHIDLNYYEVLVVRENVDEVEEE